MDLETENRIAEILMKEAAELRRQAEEEGVHAYLRKPNCRSRPNSRFLTATVLGVQQANRVVEVNEMWRVRQKELELDDRLKSRAGNGNSSSSGHHYGSSDPYRRTDKRCTYPETSFGTGCSSSKRATRDCYSPEDEGFKDDDIDEFLHSRVKRGRGAVGSRMDETGPYLPICADSAGHWQGSPGMGDNERWARHVVLGPEKPSLLHPSENYKEESLQDKRKKVDKVDSSKQHSRKSKSKEKSRNEKKKRKEERRRKHHK